MLETRHHNARRRAAATAVAIGIVLAGVAAPLSAAAQGTPDVHAWYERFVDGIAGLVYGYAWPTATYQRVELDSVSPRPNGADVVFRLHGKSAWADGDLWLQFIMHVRNGEVAGYRWGEHNGVWPPGLLSETMLAALNDMLKSSAHPPGSPPAPPERLSVSPVAVACFSNPTTQTLRYKVGIGDWTDNVTLEPGRTNMTWARTPAPSLVVTFDDGFADGYSETTLRFTAAQRTPRPTSCDDSLVFDFQLSGNRIGLFPRTWIAGFPHPFNGRVVAAAAPQTWTCAAGFRPYPWDDGEGLDCIGKDAGVIGVRLARDESSGFLRIDKVMAASPLALNGIPTGTLVFSIDGASTEQLDVAAAFDKITGRIGSSVRLVILTPGSAAQRTVSIARQ